MQQIRFAQTKYFLSLFQFNCSQCRFPHLKLWPASSTVLFKCGNGYFSIAGTNMKNDGSNRYVCFYCNHDLCGAGVSLFLTQQNNPDPSSNNVHEVNTLQNAASLQPPLSAAAPPQQEHIVMQVSEKPPPSYGECLALRAKPVYARSNTQCYSFSGCWKL
jgi:hypothetical protein